MQSKVAVRQTRRMLREPGTDPESILGVFPNSPWLTANEAGRYLKVSPRTVIRWAREGKVKGHRLSGHQRITWRFLQSDLDAMLAMPSGELTGRIQ